MRSILITAALVLTGCDQVSIPGIVGAVSGGATLHGQVASATDKTRVGLLAQPQAGGSQVELASTSASNGQFALPLNQPPISMLEMPAEDKSFVFVLSAYEDANGNGQYDAGERVHGATGGSFRWFANAGPANAAGWNVFKDGVYSAAGDTVASL